MNNWIYTTLDTIVDHIDSELNLPYTIKDRLESISSSSTAIEDQASLDSYDRVFNFSVLPFKERMSRISAILVVVGQFLIEVLKKFTTPSGFKVKWYQYPAAAALLVKFVYDLKNPTPVE